MAISLRLAPGAPEKLGHAQVGRLVLDGDVILPEDGATINERRKLALFGQISVAVAIRSRRQADRPASGPPAGHPGRGGSRSRFSSKKRSVAVFPGRRKAAAIAIGCVRISASPPAAFATRWTGKKPIVDVLLIEALSTHALALAPARSISCSGPFPSSWSCPSGLRTSEEGRGRAGPGPGRKRAARISPVAHPRDG